MQGLRVGVTGARKAAQLAAALERRGAVPVIGPLVTTDLPVPDDELISATEAVIANGPAWLAASTGVGMRQWAEVARRHGRYDHLRETLADTRRVARGAKAVGGLAAFDLTAEHTTTAETDDAVAAWISARAARDETVVVQLHGGDPSSYQDLVDDGYELILVRAYVAGRLPEDERRARQLIRAIAAGELDVVAFTSPAAVENLFALATELGEDVVTAVTGSLGASVAVAVIGPVTAQPLQQRTIPIAVTPDRHRQGELVRALEAWATRGTRDRP